MLNLTASVWSGIVDPLRREDSTGFDDAFDTSQCYSASLSYIDGEESYLEAALEIVNSARQFGISSESGPKRVRSLGLRD